MEVRLHFNKLASSGTSWTWRDCNALYSHVAVMPVGAAGSTPQPGQVGGPPQPYQILSLVCTNQNLTLTWQAIMNNSYRILTSTDPTAPLSAWSYVQWRPDLDTNLYALSPTYTFQTNLSCLFAYNPSYNPNAPLFFRISSQNYQP